MPGFTPFYGLAYFTFGDDLEEGDLARKERERFLFIDRQLYGLYNIFGNGVISGWDILTNSQSDPFSITISVGYGFVDDKFAQNTEIATIANLQPQSKYYIYVKQNNRFSQVGRQAQFFASKTLPPSTVFLGYVYVGADGITRVDQENKTRISFLQLIKNQIDNHKHRGSPSKIDLQLEVKNQLSGARVKDFDASKIVSGRFSKERIPLLDHKDLNGTGLLSHAALDSFTRLLTSGNQQLLGEIAAINTMKLITTQHYFAAKENINLSNLIEYPNLFVCYPGITPDAAIDFQASNANINLSTNCISGQQVVDGSIGYIYYENNTAFYTAIDRNNVSIALNTIKLTKGGSTAKEIEGFENVRATDSAVPNFTVSLDLLQDSVAVVSDDSIGNRTTGFYSGKFTSNRQYRVIYTRQLFENRDWTLYDELLLDVKSLSVRHGAVYMYFLNGTGPSAVQSQQFMILGADEITENLDQTLNGFERRIIDISKANKNNVEKIVFYTDDTSAQQIFWIDNIFLRASSLYPQRGYITFRHTSASVVTFESVLYEADIPSGCDVRIRVKVANSSNLLDRATYTPPLKSGDVFALTGTDIEIEVALISNAERTLTPTFRGMTLQYSSESTTTGFTIQSSENWSQGKFTSTELEQDIINPNVYNLQLADPIAVDEYYYSYENGISQSKLDGTATVGFRGLAFRDFISTQQALDIVNGKYRPGFRKPYSVYRLINKNYIVADTYNDRVVEVTPLGAFVRGVGGHNVTDDTAFYPLTASYNPKNSIMTICFSQAIVVADLDLTKIKLYIGGAEIVLSEVDSVVDAKKKDTILEILVSNDKAEQLNGATGDCFVDFASGVFKEEFAYSVRARRLRTYRGYKIFIGDFIYTNYVVKPIYANITRAGYMAICNAKVQEIETEEAGVQTVTVEVGKTVTKKAEASLSADQNVTFQSWEFPLVPGTISQFVTINTQSTPPEPRILEITVTNPTADVIGSYTLNLTANYSNGSTRTPLVINIIEAQTEEEAAVIVDAPSYVELSPIDASIMYSTNVLSFSEFALGSAYEIDNNQVLLAGLYELSQFQRPTELENETETFEQQADRKLAGYGGKTMIINKSDGAIVFEYYSPEKTYPSDAVIDTNNNIVIAESSFVANAGRIIKVDQNNNIVWQFGYGMFTRINDVRSKLNNDVIISS